jgi:hypothetical protein
MDGAEAIQLDSLDREATTTARTEVVVVARERDNRRASFDGSEWHMLGKSFPRSEVKFFSQIIILYVVIFTCLANLSIGSGDLKSVWISLLCSSLGYLMPAPGIRKQKRDEVRLD